MAWARFPSRRRACWRTESDPEHPATCSWPGSTAQENSSKRSVQPGPYRGVDVSGDGKYIAVHRHDGNGGDIWMMESARRGTMSRFTFDAAQDNAMPVWSPDGSRIVFGSLRNGKWGLYEKAADRTGGEQLLVESELPTMPMSWSPDGRFLVYWMLDPKTAGDLWAMSLTGDKKSSPLLQTPFNEGHPADLAERQVDRLLHPTKPEGRKSTSGRFRAGMESGRSPSTAGPSHVGGRTGRSSST